MPTIGSLRVANHGRNEHMANDGNRLLSVVAVLWVALPWFWPVLAGPLLAMWPDLLAWSMGVLLLGAWPWIRSHVASIAAKGWLIAATGNAVLGLLQYFNYDDALYPFLAYTMPGHMVGNVHQANLYATLLCIGVLCVWFLYREGSLRGLMAFALLMLLIVSISASASRTGLVHLVLIAFVVVHWQCSDDRWLVPVLISGLTVYLTCALLLPWALSEFWGYEVDRQLATRGLDPSCASRRVLWGNMLHLISMKPWTGWGTDSLVYAHYMTAYPGERFCAKLTHAHNLPLHTAVLWGVPAAFVLTVLASWQLLRWKPWRETTHSGRLGWAILGLLAFHSMVEYPLWFGVFQLVALLAAAMIWQSRRMESAATLQPRNGQPAMFVKVAAAMLALLLFVAWDYLKVSQLYTPRRWLLPSFREDTFMKAKNTLLFPQHVLVAQIVATPINALNAEAMLEASLEALKFAPDPRIIRQVLLAASVLHRGDLVAFHEQRFKESWPKDYKSWQAELTRGSGVATH